MDFVRLYASQLRAWKGSKRMKEEAIESHYVRNEKDANGVLRYVPWVCETDSV